MSTSFKRSRPNQGMTKDELALAQHLYSTSTEASRWAERLDPERKRDTRVVRTLDTVASSAATAFFEVTGRLLYQVKGLHELNTENPAPWTKRPYDSRVDWKPGS